MRLDKFLVETNIGSRSEVKSLIKKGCIKVNEQVASKPEMKIAEGTDYITYANKEIKYEPFVYYLLNKPAGVVSATQDNTAQTVIDLLKEENRTDLFPVGRLDKDTEGLLLITNDGDLAHNLLSPKKHVSKVYYAKIDGIVTEKEISLFQNGLDIGEKNITLPAILHVLSTDDQLQTSEIHVTITEGKFHQVKRMFQAVGMKVTYLQRIAMGNLKLDDSLPIGSYQKIEKDMIIDVTE